MLFICSAERSDVALLNNKITGGIIKQRSDCGSEMLTDGVIVQEVSLITKLIPGLLTYCIHHLLLLPGLSTRHYHVVLSIPGGCVDEFWCVRWSH